MRPKIESLGNINVSAGTSSYFNNVLNYIGQDMTTLFNTTNNNETELKKNRDIVINNSIALQKKIHILEAELEAVLDTVAAKNTTGNKFLYNSFYKKDIVFKNGMESISQDTTYGTLTLDYQDTNRLPLDRFDQEFIKKNINIERTIASDTKNILEDITLLNIIDNSDATFWTEIYEAPTSVDSITFSITIDMPRHLLPSLSFNSININPYPLYSLSLDSITYIENNSNTEYILPTFPTNNSNPIPITDISATKFVFSTLSAKSITFTFTQSNYRQSNNIRYFLLGLRNIELEIINTIKESTSFITKFTTPQEQQYFARVYLPTAVTLNDVTYNDAIHHELLLDISGNSIAQFGSDIPIDVKSIYIRTTLAKAGQIIPVLKGLKIEYQTKS